MYKIVEIFDSIQGEGLHIGQPATFIRAAGCNIHCPHCDTRYQIAEEWTEEDLGYRLDCALHHLVLTGGEPLMQPDLFAAVREAARVSLTIETNGTFPIPAGSMYWRGFTWSVSPKLPWFCPGYRPDWDTLLSFNKTWGTLQWKFVVRNMWDIEDALEMVSKVSPTKGAAIFQPPNFRQAGGTRIQYISLLRHLSELIVKMGQLQWDVRILPQLHVLEGMK